MTSRFKQKHLAAQTLKHDLMIYKERAQVYQVPEDTNCDPGLRVFRNAPDRITMQVRNRGPITTTGNGTPRNMIAHVSLTKDEAQVVVERLQHFINGTEDQLKG